MVMLKLREYQEVAADFLYENDRAMVLAAVGAGKTAIALTAMGAMLRDGYVKHWLVLAPKRVCIDVWPQEKAKWLGEVNMALAIGNPTKREHALKYVGRITGINYDNIQSIKSLKSFDGIVFDELTRLKDPSGKRYKHLLKLIEHINIRWGLTGSFTSNGLEDVFGQCKIVDTALLGKSKSIFMQEHFLCLNREYQQYVPRKEALSRVMEKIKPSTFLLESELYKDKLPPLHVVEIHCDLQDRQPYEKMKAVFKASLKGTDISALSAGAVTQKLQQMSSGFAYKGATTPSNTPGKFNTENTAHWFSSHKFDRLEELLAENQRANTIIVYNFKEELAELKRRYPYAVGMDDSKAVEKWNAGEVEVLLIHPKSAGHGLNLQYGGSKLVFLSLPWSLELYEQTIGRLLRSGQQYAVWVYLMLTNKTIDERILTALQDKKSLSDIAVEELRGCM